MDIIDGKIVRSDLTKNARGGTELMADRLINTGLDLTGTQIIFSRPDKLSPDHKKILYIHDLPEDPAIQNMGDPEFRKLFHTIVYVSHYQKMRFHDYFQIPYDGQSVVIQNAIEPIPLEDRQSDKINIIYHTTPHRGLSILYPVFAALAEDFPNQLRLKVFSSFDLYGWEQRDEPYQQLFDCLKQHPDIEYSGAVSNDVIREELQKSHIFAYPSIWEETSCLALIEAMSAACLCVHPTMGALIETSKGMTISYPYHDDPKAHAGIFYEYMKHTIDFVNKGGTIYDHTQLGKICIDKEHNLFMFKSRWENILMT